MRWTLPIVLLTWRDLTFCQFFLRRETRKLTDKLMFEKSWASVICTWPMATPRQSAFFSWNLTVLLISLNFSRMSSLAPRRAGNLPA